jgi:hypothetical protein
MCKEYKNKIKAARKELQVAMNIFAGGIEEWLWEAMNDALEDDNALVSLFEDYYFTSLIYLEISEYGFEGGNDAKAA